MSVILSILWLVFKLLLASICIHPAPCDYVTFCADKYMFCIIAVVKSQMALVVNSILKNQFTTKL